MIEVLETQFTNNVYWIPTMDVSPNSAVRNTKMNEIRSLFHSVSQTNKWGAAGELLGQSQAGITMN